MTYREKDWARAHTTLFGDGLYEQRIAELMADVRRETVEECIRIVRRDVADMVIRRLRALLDEPKAEEPDPAEEPDAAGLLHDRIGPSSGRLIAAKPVKAETKCQVCGSVKSDSLHNTWVPDPLHHNFKPEEPGHGK